MEDTGNPQLKIYLLVKSHSGETRKLGQVRRTQGSRNELARGCLDNLLEGNFRF